MEIKKDMLPAGTGGNGKWLRELYKMPLRDADAAHEEFVRRGKSREGVLGPLDVWMGAQDLKELYYKFISGEKEVFLEALAKCAFYGLPIPKWCASAFLEGYHKIKDFEFNSYDAVFGKPYPKGTHLSAKRKKRDNMFAVFYRIKDVQGENPATPIDGNLFETVGRVLGIGGKTLTEQYYYDAKNRIEDSLK